jgi:hypothetical protein
MALLDLLKQAQGGQGLEQLGRQFGLDPETTRQLAEQLAPTIAVGAKQRAKAEGGLDTLLSQFKGEKEVRYYEQPAEAATPKGQVLGEQFLEKMFGSSEVPREIASAAAARTGAPQDMVAQFLPALAAMLQGAMQKQAPDDQIEGARKAVDKSSIDQAGSGLGDLLGALGGAGAGAGLGAMLGGLLGGGEPKAAANANAPASGGGLGDLLQMLDEDGDGSPLDDIVGKFMK